MNPPCDSAMCPHPAVRFLVTQDIVIGDRADIFWFCTKHYQAATARLRTL